MTMFTSQRPGGLNTEFIEDNHTGLLALAKALGVSALALGKVASGKAPVSTEMAVRLEAGLGVAARLWLSMQAACDLDKARATTDVYGVHLQPCVLAASAQDCPGK